VPQAGEVLDHAGQQRDQRRVDDDDPVLGVVHDVDQLLGKQPQVQCVQHRAHARHGQVRHQVLGVVPHERADPFVAGHAQVVMERVGQPGRRGADLLIGGPSGTVRGPRDHFG